MSIKNKNLTKFFILSYLLFWVLIAITGLLISLEIPILIQNIMKNFIAWSPTIIILILFKSLYPNTKLKEFFKKNFLCKIKLKSFIFSFLIQLSILTIAIMIFLFLSEKEFNSLTILSFQNIIPIILITLTSGPIGEELGWRAYALNTLQKKHSPLKASIILGLLWGFWHLPLWFISGYTGLELFYYISTFLIGIISLSIIITFFYNKNKNILIAIWIHFLFNFLLKIIELDILTILTYTSLTYFAFTLILIIIKRKQFFKIK